MAEQEILMLIKKTLEQKKYADKTNFIPVSLAGVIFVIDFRFALGYWLFLGAYIAGLAIWVNILFLFAVNLRNTRNVLRILAEKPASGTVEFLEYYKKSNRRWMRSMLFTFFVLAGLLGYWFFGALLGYWVWLNLIGGIIIFLFAFVSSFLALTLFLGSRKNKFRKTDIQKLFERIETEQANSKPESAEAF